MTPADLAEVVARAIYEGRNGAGCKPWSRCGQQQPYRSDAAAAITALHAAGYSVVPSAGGWVTNQRAQLLWCVHVIGPDDLFAAESYDAAVTHANELTAELSQRSDPHDDILCLPVVAIWPWDAAGHADDLVRYAPKPIPLPEPPTDA